MKIKLFTAIICLLTASASHAQSSFGVPKIEKSWSFSASIGQATNSEGPTTTAFLRAHPVSGNYYKTRQIHAKRQSSLNIGRHYAINDWLSINWHAALSDWEAEVRTQDIYVNNDAEGASSVRPGLLMGTITGTTISGLSFSPGLSTRVPVGSLLWIVGGAQSGPLFHRGSIFSLGNKKHTAALDIAGNRWQSIVESGIELQPFRKSSSLNFFCMYQFVYLSKGSGQSEWTHFQQFSQVNFGVRIASMR
ncbi:MAG: hypothetical protein ACK417_08145 [Bacteroidia bacterium]